MKTIVAPRFGQVWTTKLDYDVPVGNGRVVKQSVEEGDYVLVLSNSDASPDPNFPVIQVIPLVFPIKYATDRDLIIPAEANPAKFECMAPFWNLSTMLERNLDEFLGEISDKRILRGLELLWRQEFGLDVSVDELNTMPIGSGILNFSKKTLEFQMSEWYHAMYLRIPALVVQ